MSIFCFDTCYGGSLIFNFYNPAEMVYLLSDRIFYLSWAEHFVIFTGCDVAEVGAGWIAILVWT